MATASVQPPPSTADGDGDRRISSLHPDILQTHILTRLDGPTLASAACTSSELHTLSTKEKLWQRICFSTWPSINDPTVNSVISTFPSGHRSFFSDSYPLLLHHHHHHRSLDRPFPATTELISAVDIYYQNVPIFSKVAKTETVTGWFLCSPFRIDLLERKEFVQTWIQHNPSDKKDLWLEKLEEEMTLSWILIDPNKKRAMNVSSLRPVSVQRHWLTGEVVVKFATVMGGGGGKGSEKEVVECGVVVTCGEKKGGEVHVREVCMGMEDMEGRYLSGKDSLVILHGVMEEGVRGRGKGGKEVKEGYREFLEEKKKLKERKERKEKVLDMVCIAIGIIGFLGFWSFALIR